MLPELCLDQSSRATNLTAWAAACDMAQNLTVQWEQWPKWSDLDLRLLVLCHEVPSTQKNWRTFAGKRTHGLLLIVDIST